MMKNSCLAILLAVFTAQLVAQNYTDAARFTERCNVGDARYVSMGGAFGSLGANVASIADNPAAVGVFNKGGMEISLGNKFSDNINTLLDQDVRSRTAHLSINNFGVVMRFPFDDKGTSTRSLNFSYSLNRVSDFYSKMEAQADMSASSMTDDFLYDVETNGLDNANTNSQDAWASGLIMFDSLSGNYATDFVWGPAGNRVSGPYGVKQLVTVNSSGRVHDNSFAMGIDLNSKLYLGGSINISALEYDETYVYSEEDVRGAIPEFEKFLSSRGLQQEGRGVNLRAGIIYKPFDVIRLGISYHFPSSWSVNEYYSSYTTASFTIDNVRETYSSPANDEGEYSYSYTLITPGRLGVGASVVLLKTLIISADYEYCNYNRATFDSDDYSFSSTNKDVQNMLRATGVLKCGAEMRVGQLRFRLGSAIHQSPYTRYAAGLGQYKNVFGGGVGVNTGSFFMDMSLSHSMAKGFKHLYTDYWGNYQAVESKNNDTQLLISFGTRF